MELLEEYKETLAEYKTIKEKLYKLEMNIIDSTSLKIGDKVKVLTTDNTFGFIIGPSINEDLTITTKLHKCTKDGAKSTHFHDTDSLNYHSHLIDVKLLEKV